MSFIKNHSFIVIALFFLILGCGRKQKNIFSFDPEVKNNITKLDLPSVRGLMITKSPQGNLLSWFGLSFTKEKSLLQKYFVGYDVFRLTSLNFIPKHPLNKTPLTETHFLDEHTAHKKDLSQKRCYLIQPIFKFDKQILKGPSSQIICVEN
jgi:hypothetical protein